MTKAWEQNALITPRDVNGNPSATGKIGFASLGMSNTRMEFDVFKSLANADTRKSPQIVLVNGAKDSQTAEEWAKEVNDSWDNLASKVARAGLSKGQLQVVWMKLTISGPSQKKNGPFPGFIEDLRDYQATILQHLKREYPNVGLVFLSNRIYAGYSTLLLSPEPYAYEGGFANQLLIEDQINGGGTTGINYPNSPVVVWGPNLWADGTTPNSEGLYWECSDVSDGVHPSEPGKQKVALKLLNFLLSDPLASNWFTGQKLSPTQTPNPGQFTPTPTFKPTAVPPSSTPTRTPAIIPPSSTPTSTSTYLPSSSTPTPMPGSNMLVNGSFEIDNNGDSRPDSWSSISKFTRSSDYVYSGSYSGKFSATDNLNFLVGQTVNSITAGRSYVFTGYVNIPQTTDTFSITIDIIWRNSSGAVIYADPVKSFNSPTTGWVQATATKTAPSDTVSADIRMKITNLNAVIYVDNFSFN